MKCCDFRSVVTQPHMRWIQCRNWKKYCTWINLLWLWKSPHIHARHYHIFCRMPTHTHARTHTHPFNGPFFRTTRVGRYQKSKTHLDFTEARDSEWQWHQLGHMQVCRQITTPTPHHSVFYRLDALPATQPTASKHCQLQEHKKVN